MHPPPRRAARPTLPHPAPRTPHPARREPGVLSRIRRLTRMPYFLPHGATNFRNIMASPEMWLSAAEAGAKAHADEHCEATMSVQLSGTKRWRIGPMPPITHANFTTRRSLSDGVLTMTSPAWEPAYVFDLHAGEGVFFPPGYVHETTNVGGTCAASITYQYDAPPATGYIRSMLERIAVTEEMAECWTKWAGYATARLPTMDMSREDLPATPAAIDTDHDGALSTPELRAWLEGLAREHPYVTHQVDDGTAARFGGVAAAWASMLGDLVAAVEHYHDTDGDGVVTTGEVSGNIAAWQAANSTGWPARNVSAHHRAYSDRGACTFPDMVPTWATTPQAAPAAPPRECRDHVAYYLGLLADNGFGSGAPRRHADEL